MVTHGGQPAAPDPAELERQLCIKNGEITTLRARLMSIEEQSMEQERKHLNLVNQLRSNGPTKGSGSHDMQQAVSKLETQLKFREKDLEMAKSEKKEMDESLQQAYQKIRELAEEEKHLVKEKEAIEKELVQSRLALQMQQQQPAATRKVCTMQEAATQTAATQQEDAAAEQRRSAGVEPRQAHHQHHDVASSGVAGDGGSAQHRTFDGSDDNERKSKRLKVISLILPAFQGCGNFSDGERGRGRPGNSWDSRTSQSKSKSTVSDMPEKNNISSLHLAMSNFVQGHLQAHALLEQIDECVHQATGSVSAGVNMLQSLLYVSHESRRVMLEAALCYNAHKDSCSVGESNAATITRQPSTGTPQHSSTRLSESASTFSNTATTTHSFITHRDREHVLASSEVETQSATRRAGERAPLLIRIMEMLEDEFCKGALFLWESLMEIVQLVANDASDKELQVFECMVYSEGGILCEMIRLGYPGMREAALSMLAILLRCKRLVEICTGISKDQQLLYEVVSNCLDDSFDTEAGGGSRVVQQRALRVFSMVAVRYRDGIELLFRNDNPLDYGKGLPQRLGNLIVKEVECLCRERQQGSQTMSLGLVREAVQLLAMISAIRSAMSPEIAVGAWYPLVNALGKLERREIHEQLDDLERVANNLRTGLCKDVVMQNCTQWQTQMR